MSDPGHFPERADAVVIGAGFGGLAAALRLTELGARVVVVETLRYPGGCASTFERNGFRFEAGATLFSGLGEGQLFRRWIDRYRMDVNVEWVDPVVELRSPVLTLAVPKSRARFVEMFLELPGAPREALRRFFERQGEVAEVLWGLLDEPDLLPPFRLGALRRHVVRTLDYARLAPLAGRTLLSVLERFRLDGFEPLRLYLDALCRITVQCSLREAEALFALGAMDYYFRGTGHVRGGIGRLATALAEAVRSSKGFVSFATEARALERTSGGWRVATRRGAIETPMVVANLLPQTLERLAGRELHPSARALSRRVEKGFGAAMIYRVTRAPASQSFTPAHLALVADASAPLIEGNHVFCSMSGAYELDRAPEGYRTVTMSTHVDPMAGKSAEETAGYVRRVHACMRRTARKLAPEWESEVLHEMTASPRTFERFTSRPFGLVGGIPKRSGLDHYRSFEPRPALPGVYLVGDSIFPGQSTLAAAIGGWKLAQHLAA